MRSNGAAAPRARASVASSPVHRCVKVSKEKKKHCGVVGQALNTHVFTAAQGSVSNAKGRGTEMPLIALMPSKSS